MQRCYALAFLFVVFVPYTLALLIFDDSFHRVAYSKANVPDLTKEFLCSRPVSLSRVEQFSSLKTILSLHLFLTQPGQYNIFFLPILLHTGSFSHGQPPAEPHPNFYSPAHPPPLCRLSLRTKEPHLTRSRLKQEHGTHRSTIVISTLNLIPGVATSAVILVANVLQHYKTKQKHQKLSSVGGVVYDFWPT